MHGSTSDTDGSSTFRLRLSTHRPRYQGTKPPKKTQPVGKATGQSKEKTVLEPPERHSPCLEDESGQAGDGDASCVPIKLQSNSKSSSRYLMGKEHIQF